MQITVKNRIEKEFLLGLFCGMDTRYYRSCGDFNVGVTFETRHWNLHDTPLPVPQSLLDRGFCVIGQAEASWNRPRAYLRRMLGIPSNTHRAVVFPAKLPADIGVRYAS